MSRTQRSAASTSKNRTVSLRLSSSLFATFAVLLIGVLVACTPAPSRARSLIWFCEEEPSRP